jgi:hypothetical protein
LGIIDGSSVEKHSTPSGKELGSALINLKKDDREKWEIWKKIIMGNSFCVSLLDDIASKDLMDKRGLQTRIIYLAGYLTHPRDAETGAKVLIKIFENIGFIKKSGKKFLVSNEYKTEKKEDDFLKMEFSEISLEEIGLEPDITNTINLRLNEIKKCIDADSPLAVIFLSGSTLEGILLGVALNHKEQFNKSKASPKDKEGKVKKFQQWTLNDLIDVSYDLGILKEDVKRHSHELREFRNYIHVYEQVKSGFNPDLNTAKISWQVLNAAIFQISKNKI